MAVSNATLENVRQTFEIDMGIEIACASLVGRRPNAGGSGFQGIEYADSRDFGVMAMNDLA